MRPRAWPCAHDDDDAQTQVNGYGNYRHQADACHAYQIAKKKGIPEKQIILFMYDDIAHSTENPIPGKVFNQPDGKDVYPLQGVVHW